MSRRSDEIRLIDELASNCREKLRENADKPHWKNHIQRDLLSMLIEEVLELSHAISDGESPENVWREAADVANFAAFIADNYEKREEDK